MCRIIINMTLQGLIFSRMAGKKTRPLILQRACQMWGKLSRGSQPSVKLPIMRNFS